MIVAALTALSSSGAVDTPVPILASDYSIFDSGPGTIHNRKNLRKINLPIPTIWAAQGPDSAVNEPSYELALLSADPLALASSIAAFSVANPLSKMLLQTCNGGLEKASAIRTMLVSSGLYIRGAESLAAELANQLNFYNTNRSEAAQHTYSYSTPSHREPRGLRFRRRRPSPTVQTLCKFRSAQKTNSFG